MPPCSFHGCERQVKYAKTGWCQTHYHRWWRTGKVNGKKQERGASGKDAVSWKGDDVCYRTVHTRLARTRGVARKFLCSCGSTADHWSYDGSDPCEKQETIVNTWGTRVVQFSTDLNCYQPLCLSCHVSRDRWADAQERTHCANGHEMTKENTYTRPSAPNTRDCRTCRHASYLRRRRSHIGVS